MREKAFYAIIIILYIGLVGLIGAFFAVPVSPAYNALNLPSFIPKLDVFVLAWAVVYTCAGVASYFTFKAGQKRLLYLYALNGAFNALYPYIFFEKGNIGFAFAIILILFATVYYIVRKSKDKTAKLLLMPYLALLLIALILNYSIIVLN